MRGAGWEFGQHGYGRKGDAAWYQSAHSVQEVALSPVEEEGGQDPQSPPHFHSPPKDEDRPGPSSREVLGADPYSLPQSPGQAISGREPAASPAQEPQVLCAPTSMICASQWIPRILKHLLGLKSFTILGLKGMHWTA